MRAKLTPYFLLTASALFWGGNFVVGRAMSIDVPPIAMTFWRFFGALLILSPFMAGPVWRHRRALVANWPLLLALGVTGISAFHSFVYTALASTTAINAALFMALTPLAIPLFAYGLNNDAPSRRQVVGIGLSFVGVLVLVTRGDLSALAALRFNHGDLWMAAAFPLWSLYTVLLKRCPRHVPPAVLLIGIMGVGVALLIPAYLWEYAQVGGFSPNLETLGGLAFLAVFASALAYTFWNRGVGEIGAAGAGPFVHLVPVFATLLAVIFLEERLYPYHLAGAALIAIGVFAASGMRLQRA